MPEPIRPAPTTPTVRTFMAPSPRGPIRRPPPIGWDSAPAGRFDDHSDTLAAADAGGGQTVPPAAASQFQKQGQHQARSGGTQWVAQRDGTTVDVDALSLQGALPLD